MKTENIKKKLKDIYKFIKDNIFEISSLIFLVVFIVNLIFITNTFNITKQKEFFHPGPKDNIVCNEFGIAYYKHQIYFLYNSTSPVIGSDGQFVSCEEYNKLRSRNVSKYKQ